MREIELQLADINLDDVYDFSYPHLPERSSGLEEKFPGLPLLVIDRERRLVSGHDYRMLLRDRGIPRVRALEVDLPPADALLLNYNILRSLFGLNLYEELLFLKKISPLCPVEAIRRRSELPFTLNGKLLENLDLLLSEPFRVCLAAGRLGLPAALQLTALAAKDRRSLLSLFASCKFSESQQARIVQVLEETAFREKRSLAAQLAASGLGELLQQEMPQKKIIEALQALRYPAYTRMEADWHFWRKKTAPENIALAHAPLFAREEIQVTLTVKNRAAAETLLAKLKKLF